MTDEQNVKSDSPAKPKLKLTGKNGNAFAILGEVREACRRNKMMDKWPEIRTEMMSGNYDNLLVTAMRYFEVS